MGVFLSILAEQFPPKSKFAVDDIPDLSGKVMIVTGGNTGIGFETVKALLLHNAKTYLAARNPEKAADAIAKLKAETGKEAIFLKLDLADLKAIKSAAAEFNSKEKELHVLFNSGGVMAPPIDQLTADGYDLQFGTNVLGHYYLTTLLMPALLAGTKTSGDGHARVVNTSSIGHWGSSLYFNTFKDGPARKKKGTESLYSQSKTGNIIFAVELQRRYADQGIVSTSLHPGSIETDLQRHLGPVVYWLVSLQFHPAAMGALTQLWAGTSPEGKDLGGKYLVPWARLGVVKKVTQDPELGKELWTWLEEQTQGI